MLSQHHICPRISRPVPSSDTKPGHPWRHGWCYPPVLQCSPCHCRHGDTVAKLFETLPVLRPRPTRSCPAHSPDASGAVRNCLSVWPGLPRALRMRPRPSFRPQKCRKVVRGCAPSNPAPKGGTPPLRNPPVPHHFSGQCARKSGHFFQELLLSVHGREGLSRPFPRLVRGSDAVGGA